MEVSVNSSAPPDVNSSHSHSCYTSPAGSSIFTAFTVTNTVLLLPLSVFILSFGFQRWWKQRGSVTFNPIDVFTYHMLAMEMVGISASISCSYAALTVHKTMVLVGCNMFAVNSCVKMFFHVLTCVERYLAVVHPITYLRLSKTGGAMIRNVGLACVWLVCAGVLILRFLLEENFNLILFFFNLVSSLVITSFCSLSVLHVLNRPGPGEGSGKNEQADKSKQRAFTTIMAIMAVLFLRFGGNLVCQTLAQSPLLSQSARCVVMVSGIWFCLPSSYVLPLLFLHRAEKLPCFKYNSQSG